MVAVVSGCLVVSGVALYIAIKRNRKEKLRKRKTSKYNPDDRQSNATTTAMMDVEVSMKGYDMESTATAMMSATAMMPAGGSTTMIMQGSTVVTTQKELSMPGFLDFKLDKDFRMGKELTRGGGGAVFNGAVVNPEILRITRSDDLIVKVVLIPKGEEQHIQSIFQQEVSIMWLLRSEKNIAKVKEQKVCPVLIYCSSQDTVPILWPS
jgi:hypothetical protein